jgi:hypothetical protein
MEENRTVETCVDWEMRVVEPCGFQVRSGL